MPYVTFAEPESYVLSTNENILGGYVLSTNENFGGYVPSANENVGDYVFSANENIDSMYGEYCVIIWGISEFSDSPSDRQVMLSSCP